MASSLKKNKNRIIYHNLIQQYRGLKMGTTSNAAEWELKCQRSKTSSLTTLFHMEPSPRALHIVPQVLLLNYGWPHKKAGSKYPANEMSFRQTINGLSRSDRGFMVILDHAEKKVTISFDSTSVHEKHASWLETVNTRIGLSELNPQPYWGFDDLFHKAGTKLFNCFYIQADSKIVDGQEYFCYKDIMMLSNFSINKFLDAIEKGYIYIDFDARTGHNHGTKFRLLQNRLPYLYDAISIIS